jgi:DDE_Tnp_1-associated
MEMILDEELPKSRLAVLLKHFSQIEDGRQSSRVAFPLAEMLLLLTCATIADCDDFDEIVAWGCRYRKPKPAPLFLEGRAGSA